MYSKRFGDFFDITQPCRIIDKYTFIDYRKHLIAIAKSDFTINNKLRGIRAIFNFCISQNYIAQPFQMELIKTIRKIKETYTDIELNVLFKKPPKNCNFSEFRNWVLVQYLYGTGQRLNTVRNIKIKDVDLKSKLVLLTTLKNGMQKLFPLSDKLIPILRQYMNKRKGKPDDYLFCNIYGEQFTRNGLGEAVRKYNLKHGVKKTSSHLFRHSFARQVVRNGGQLGDVQDLLTHETLAMSKVYLDQFSPVIQQKFSNLDPLNGFNNGKKAISMKD